MQLMPKSDAVITRPTKFCSSNTNVHCRAAAERVAELALLLPDLYTKLDKLQAGGLLLCLTSRLQLGFAPVAGITEDLPCE